MTKAKHDCRIVLTIIGGIELMAKYICTICNYVYDEEAEGVSFDALDENWVCPLCGAPKEDFELLED